MYRYIVASQLSEMFDEFDLQDFGDFVVSKLKRNLLIDDMYVSDIHIDAAADGKDYLEVTVCADGKYSTSRCKLDGRKIKRQRDLITYYTEPVFDDLMFLIDRSIPSEAYFTEQEFTSKQTASGNGSFNKGQGRVPALFKKISWSPGTVNFDYGCGYKSTQDRISEFLEDRGVEYIGFDKFNQTSQEQSDAWKAIRSYGGADTVTCANVLNVVKEHDVRVNEIISNIYNVLKSGGTAYFDVYEGDKSSEGAQTGKDNYQLKRPIDRYIEEVSEIFGEDNVKLKGKVIIAKK